MSSDLAPLMFHHFHNEKFPLIQGSITGEEFGTLIEKTIPNGLISADEWKMKYLKGRLKENEICITFDDNLKSQYEIALPILEKFELKAFWFIYTSPFEGILERIEVYRFFRNIAFKSVDEFYNAFFAEFNESEKNKDTVKSIQQIDYNDYLKQFPFYTYDDRKFRFYRDEILGAQSYFRIMDNLIVKKGFDKSFFKDIIYIDKNELKEISDLGHEIGLHSHTHPTNLAALSKEDQQNEYVVNSQKLKTITGKHIDVMAHPSNSYNDSTLQILEELGVRFGFCSNNKIVSKNKYELKRMDYQLLKL